MLAEQKVADSNSARGTDRCSDQGEKAASFLIMALPSFRYHPDPLATGSIEASETICAGCGQARGYVYVGASYGEDEYVDCTCCGDAAAFLGALGYIELVQLGEPVIEAIHKTAEDFGDSWDETLHALRKNGSPTAYIFRCLHCGKDIGYSDSN